MIKLTPKWRSLTREQLTRSRKKPRRNAWVSPLMILSSIQCETMNDSTITLTDERVLARVASIVRHRPYGLLYEPFNPYTPKADSKSFTSLSRSQIVSNTLGRSI